MLENRLLTLSTYFHPCHSLSSWRLTRSSPLNKDSKIYLTAWQGSDNSLIVPFTASNVTTDSSNLSDIICLKIFFCAIHLSVPAVCCTFRHFLGHCSWRESNCNSSLWWWWCRCCKNNYVVIWLMTSRAPGGGGLQGPDTPTFAGP